MLLRCGNQRSACSTVCSAQLPKQKLQFPNHQTWLHDGYADVPPSPFAVLGLQERERNVSIADGEQAHAGPCQAHAN
jgi:hypothetical protein